MIRLSRTCSGRVTAILLIAGLSLSGCATNEAEPAASTSLDDTDAVLARMLSGQSMVEGDALDAKLAETAAYPLGSKENPVRAQGPAGQRAYLARLRCADTSRPDFYRGGSAGVSPYGNIVDVYIVTCKGGEPAESSIFIDMYHRGHVETEAVPGYGIMGGRAP